MKRTSYVCVNCGHGSLVRTNFKLTSQGVAYCTREKCSDIYNQIQRNNGARQKGEKVDD